MGRSLVPGTARTHATNEVYSDLRQGRRSSGWMPSGRPGRRLYDMRCLPILTRGPRMEVVHDPTVLEVIQRARIKVATARRVLAIADVKLATAKRYTAKAGARAIQLRAPAAAASIR